MDETDQNYCDRCIEKALSAIKAGNYIRAESFLRKAEKVNPSEHVIDLLQYVKREIHNASRPENESNDKTRTNLYSNGDQENIGNENEYTIEQVEVVKKIKKCKDYYEVLGVAKDATEIDIKKAYKKLALQLHPDKNRAPGAAEAFKTIGNAAATLADTRKRKEYDLFGSRNMQNASNHHQYSRPSNYHMGRNNYEYAYERRFESDISAEELFNMFFGTGFPQHRTARYANRHRESYQQPSLAFGLILILVIISMLSSFLTSNPLYSLGKTSKYNVKRQTTHLGIPYYVRENFAEEYQGSLVRLENSVEEDYIITMKQNCYRERNYRESMIARARSFGTQSQVATAESLKAPSCDNLVKIGLTRYSIYQ